MEGVSMKNLLARERDRRDGRLWCPLLDTTTCRREGCAHYSPDDTQECIHVLAAQAQVRIADALEALADTVHTGFDGTRHLQIKR
jgi:hypothetical protein